jgi:rubrerythrin
MVNMVQNTCASLKEVSNSQVAEEASFSVSKTGDRAAALRQSLAGELEEARLAVQAACAARKRAEKDIQSMQEAIAALEKEDQQRRVCAQTSPFGFLWALCGFAFRKHPTLKARTSLLEFASEALQMLHVLVTL